MTREMNKPDWCRFEHTCFDLWQVKGRGYAIIDICKTCQYNKLKQRVLNPDIKEFFERCCNMERLK